MSNVATVYLNRLWSRYHTTPLLKDAINYPCTATKLSAVLIRVCVLCVLRNTIGVRRAGAHLIGLPLNEGQTILERVKVLAYTKLHGKVHCALYIEKHYKYKILIDGLRIVN